MTDTSTVLIVDDHPLFRTALSGTLAKHLPLVSILEASDFESLQRTIDATPQLDLILLDLQMPGCQGFSALVYLNAQRPEVPVVIVSAHEEAVTMQRAIDLGASGFLPKSASPESIESALRAVMSGNLWLPEGIDSLTVVDDAERNAAQAIASLTPQQFRVASMVHDGLLNKQIAHELHVTEATVKAHITEIFRKLGVHARTQVVLAMERLAVTPQALSLEETSH